MLAVLGFIATDFMRLPGDMYSFDSIPKTIDIHDALLKTGPMYQLLLWIGKGEGEAKRSEGSKGRVVSYSYTQYSFVASLLILAAPHSCLSSPLSSQASGTSW